MSDSAQPPDPRTAIVLAGRRGGEDALALAGGATHRALLLIEGEPMLLRVVKRLLERPEIDRIVINIDAPELLETIPEFRDLRDRAQIEVLRSTSSPSLSVLESLDHAGLKDGPILVTTADHALLDDAMLDHFFTESRAQQADLSFALVPRTTIEARFPETRRTYLPFREESYSGANLFLFRTPIARKAAEFWQRVENDRKQPWRLARAFGLTTLLLFLARRLTLKEAMVRASATVGARIEAIPIPIAEAAVDVDKIEDLKLVRRILQERAGGAR